MPVSPSPSNRMANELDRHSRAEERVPDDQPNAKIVHQPWFVSEAENRY